MSVTADTSHLIFAFYIPRRPFDCTNTAEDRLEMIELPSNIHLRAKEEEIKTHGAMELHFVFARKKHNHALANN